jgi:Glyoxalase-like domain
MSLRLPIDHVVIPVVSLVTAGQAFEAAGFHVTPEARHSPTMGTANRCVMFERTYIELIGIVAETAANATWRKVLEAGPGIGGFAFKSEVIEATAVELRKHEINAETVRHFSREVDGGELRFSVIRIDPKETPGLQRLFCQHHTRELLWQSGLMRHPNGAALMLELALPKVDLLARFADETGPLTVLGTGRLTITGKKAARHDLRTICGVESEVVAR